MSNVATMAVSLSGKDRELHDDEAELIAASTG
jgi:hypothetical protein